MSARALELGMLIPMYAEQEFDMVWDNSPDIVVLHPRLLDRFQEVNGWARPQVDTVFDLSVFEPGAAFFLPDGLLVEFVEL